MTVLSTDADRRVPRPAATGVLAVIGAVISAAFLSGCQGPPGEQASTATTSPAAPTTSEPGSTGPGPYKVTATVAVKAYELAVDPGTHTVYVTNSEDAVSVIDGATHTIAATVPVEGGARDVAVDPGSHTVYVANTENTVSVIDGATRTVTATVPVGEGPGDVAVDPGTHTVYVTTGRMCGNRGFCYGNGTVSVIDGATRTVAGTLSVGSETRGLAVDPNTNTVYVTTDKGVSVIDGATRTVTATVPLTDFPDNVAVDPGTHTVYVTTGEGISVIDGATRTVTATIPLGKDTQPNVAQGRTYDVAVDPATHTVYVSYDSNATLSVIDGATRTVTAEVTLPGDEPTIHPLAVDPDSHTVYVGDGVVTVIERQT